MHLDDLANPFYWKGLAAEDGTVGLTVVLPTGRAADSITPHLALISDALHLPLIALAIDRLCRTAHVQPLRLSSLFDIDFCDAQAEGPAPEQEDNLLIIGSADVNLAAAHLLEQSHSYERLQAGFTKPYEQPSIRGVDGKLHMFTVSPNAGLLVMYKNPWTQKNRIVLLVGGLLANGTIAATHLLIEYLHGATSGNNLANPELPLKIVHGIPRRYRNLELKSVNDCLPPMELGNISGIKVEE